MRQTGSGRFCEDSMASPDRPQPASRSQLWQDGLESPDTINGVQKQRRKTVRYLIILVALLGGCASMSNYMDNGEGLFRENQARYMRGDIGELEFSQRALDLSLQYMPESYAYHAHIQDRIILSSQLERGEITLKQFNAQWAGRQRDYEMRRQQHAQQYANQPINPLGAVLMMNMFNNSMNRNFPRPSHCTSYELAGTTHTDCY